MPDRIEQRQSYLPNNICDEAGKRAPQPPREPCFYSSYSEIPQRDLSIHFYENEPVGSIVTLAYSFTLLSELSENLNFSVEAKAYIEALHGVETPDYYGSLSPQNYFEELDRFMVQARKELHSPCVPSISGTFDVCARSPQALLGRPLSKFVIPMVDLEITATGHEIQHLERDLGTVSEILKENKFSGFLLRSGDIHKGGYCYMSDFALPFNPGFWETMGLFMVVLIDTNNPERNAQQNISRSQSLGQKLLETRSLVEAREIANEISKTFPSIPSEKTRPGLYFDPRWIYHKLEAGNNCLMRPTSAKGYKSPPQLVGEIY